jgi:hypothetical protein
MYPTLFAGCILLVAAGRYALSPRRGRLAPIVGLGVLTTFVASLGFVTGCIKTFIATGELDNGALRERVIVIGVGESLHNVAFGLVLLVLATAGVVVGLSRRSAKPAGAELVDPHAG